MPQTITLPVPEGATSVDLIIDSIFYVPTTTTTTTSTSTSTSTTTSTTTTSTTTSTTTKPPAPLPFVVEGFGSGVTGGSASGSIYRVTNLNSSGAGSFANGVASNRTIVFDVSGNIPNYRFLSTVANLTIDANGKDVTLNGNSGSIFAFEGSANNNIILRGLRFAGSPGEDYVTITDGAHHIVVDRCSFGFGSGLVGDGLLDITSDAHDVTVQWSLFGKSTSGSMLVAYAARNVSIHHNLFSPASANNVGERNPNLSNQSGTPGIVDVRNNLVWKWGRNNGTGSGYGANVSHGSTANIVNNYYYSVASPSDAIITDGHYGSYPKGSAYVAGNVSGNSLDINRVSNHAEYAIPSQYAITNESACDAARRVLQLAGTSVKNAAEQSLINSIILTNC